MLKDLQERLFNAYLEQGHQGETFWRLRNHSSPGIASSGFYVPVEVNQAAPHRSISLWTKVHARRPDLGRDFYEALDRESWIPSAIEAGFVTLDEVETRSCRLGKIVQSMLFKRTLDLPYMSIVSMGEFDLYKKEHIVFL